MNLKVQIPGYRILKTLGEGGMATVYLAVQQSLDREVALKVMSPMLAANQSFCERFLKEGRITAQLTHPNLVTIHDIGSYEGVYYFASEYLPAGTLRERMARRLSVAEALDVARDLAMGLSFAHEKGFVHRDVKPGNILFRTNGTAVLADFGIAKAINSTSNATMAGSAIGTPDYMSPEQAQATGVDGRADLYGLGAVLYEMLTGTKPYRASDPYTVALMHVTEPVPKLPQSLAWLQPLIDGLMAKQPDDRYPTGEAFVNACDKLLMDQPQGRLLRDAHDTRKRISPRLRSATSASDGPTIAASISNDKPRWRPRVVAFGLAVIFVFICAGLVVWRFAYMGAKDPSAISANGITLLNPKPADPTNDADSNPLDTLDTPALLAKAEEYLQFGTTSKEYPGRKLVFPEGDSAVDMYKKVIEREPLNISARQGLKTIADFFMQSAQKAHNLGLDIQALDLAEKGLRADPESSELKKLKIELEKSVANRG